MGRVPLSPVNGRRSRRRSSMRAGACDILLGSRFRKRIVSAPVWGAGVVARDTRRRPDNFNRVLLGACFTMYPPQSDPLRRRGTVAWTTHSNVARRPSSALRRVPCPVRHLQAHRPDPRRTPSPTVSTAHAQQARAPPRTRHVAHVAHLACWALSTATRWTPSKGCQTFFLARIPILSTVTRPGNSAVQAPLSNVRRAIKKTCWQ
jgi:hypothetical protein